MARAKLFSIGQAVVLALIALTLYLRRDTALGLLRPALVQDPDPDPLPNACRYTPLSLCPSSASDSEIGTLSRDKLTAYVDSILDPADRHLPRLECPQPDLSRYEYLKPTAPAPSETRYLFALNLRECLPLLPRLIGSVVEAIRFLGPEHCALSIVEGNSPDGTAEVLAALQPHLSKLTRTHVVLSNEIDPLHGHRFAELAKLRNMALKPVLNEPGRYSNATVIFLNDVAICLEDILELVHQRHALGADMTCALDWVYGDDGPVFYDVYIARAINGDTFFEIPPYVSWARASNLFWNEPTSRERFDAHRPFQAFSCWNGAVAFTAAPVAEGKVAFRASKSGECHQGEPQLFCKDMWFQGHGKIAVVPSVSLEYSDAKARLVKAERGYTSQWIGKDAGPERGIEWRPPPEKVKCMPSFDRQFWLPWNETMA